ncbi:MAG: substrate-binding domain-containing protein [Ramlibacter sp.]|nr:substrate-binding domain-containing protein [Ramlibacter sp.]
MQVALKGISSMATRQLLADLAGAWQRESGTAVAIESVGGVDAARRVQAGEPFDFVVLAADAIDKLIAAERVVAGARFDLVRSGVAVAVRAGDAQPDLSTEDAVRRAVQGAKSIGYSTGPSGVALTRLFERWGIAEEIKDRIVQATPGVPVGSLVARGEVALGFQQLSELLNVGGIAVVGMLPDSIQITTTFSGGICTASTQADAVRAMFSFMTSPQADEAKRRQGMDPA